MPRAKREKLVSLTKVKKKTKETKRNLIEEIRKSVDSYNNLFIFTVDRMKTDKFLKVRQHFKKTSRFFFGKNNVMAVALGRTEDAEYAKGLSEVSRHLKGQCGIMLTNDDKELVIKHFKRYCTADFARSGEVASKTVELQKGPLHQFPFSIEYKLRQLGLPTKLDKGVITLTSDCSVCKEGEKLTSEQVRLLQYLDIHLSTFRINIVGHWSKNSGADIFN